MAGFQFTHIATYSRKGNGASRSVASVLSEADRATGAAPHVASPAPPVRIFGISPGELQGELDRLIADQSAALTGAGRGRAIRVDTHILATQVASYPVPRDTLATDPAAAATYAAWRQAVVDHVRADWHRRGWVVRSIVEHVDEAYPHLHVLGHADPALSARLDAKEGHPGHRAARSAPDDKTAFREAMRAFQNTFHREVGMAFGHARLGPGRRRLSRGDWQREQAAAEALARTASAAAILDREARAAAHIVRSNARVEAHDIKGAAVIAAGRMRHAAEDEAARLRREAEADRLAAARERTAMERLRDAAQRTYLDLRARVAALGDRLDRFAPLGGGRSSTGPEGPDSPAPGPRR